MSQQPVREQASRDSRRPIRRYGVNAVQVPWQLIAIGAAAFFLGLFVVDVMRGIARPLALLFIAIAIAEALAPAVDRLSRVLPHVVSVLLVYLLLIAAFAGIGWLIVPPLVDQAAEVSADAPMLVDETLDWIERRDVVSRDQVVSTLTGQVESLSGQIIGLPLTIASFVLELVLVIAMSIYWQLSRAELRGFVLSLFPSGRRDRVGQVLGDLGSTIGGYLRAETIDAVIVGVLVWIGMSVIGVQYPLVLALVSALGELVPTIGPILSTVPAVLIALLDSPTTAVITLVFFLILQQVESNILLPNIMRNQSDIPPLLVIFALFAGAAVGGILGALVAIPLFGAAKVLVVEVFAPWIRQWAGVPGTGEEMTS